MKNTPPQDFIYAPPQGALDIIHQDDDILVINKPSELLSVPGRLAEHADSLATRVQNKLPSATIVHRLDMSTSGLLIMALNAAAHKRLSRQFEKRATDKLYIARVWGHITEDEGLVDQPLICDWPNRPKQIIDHENGKPSQTRWRVMEREEGSITRLALTPITGRTHQLRVHMLHLGHPILGDDFYAHEKALSAANRLQLHAQDLIIYHPTTDERITFTAPCPF